LLAFFSLIGKKELNFLKMFWRKEEKFFVDVVRGRTFVD